MNRIDYVKVQLIKETSEKYPNAFICSPDEAVEIVRQKLELVDREYFIALLLNSKNKVIAINTVSSGTLNASLVHPREVFKAAILANAASIIVAHNHPSGDASPSREDIAVTERLVKAGNILDIPVLDHLIIGNNSIRWVSLKERGVLKNN